MTTEEGTAPYRIPARPDPDMREIAKRYDPDDVAGQIAHAANIELDRMERNRRNSAHAAAACVAYVGKPVPLGPNDEEVISDLLTDLRHLADELGLDIDAIWESAERGHADEVWQPNV